MKSDARKAGVTRRTATSASAMALAISSRQIVPGLILESSQGSKLRVASQRGEVLLKPLQPVAVLTAITDEDLRRRSPLSISPGRDTERGLYHRPEIDHKDEEKRQEDCEVSRRQWAPGATLL